MNKKVVVFGALGLVGRSVINALESRERLADRRRIAARAGFREPRALRFARPDGPRCVSRTFVRPPNSPTSRTSSTRRCTKSRSSSPAGAIPNRSPRTPRCCVNALEVLGRQPSLRHVTLLQGTKAYGAHIAPMRIPGREREPRHPGANFYWNQEDHLIELSARRRWTYSIMRPQVVCGFALGSPMNMLSALGVLAAVQRERGEPLRFPGGAPCITQATDADLLARAIVWAAEDPAARTRRSTSPTATCMVWQEIFRVVAEVFGMPLARTGADAPRRRDAASTRRLWQQIVQRHDLVPHSMDGLIGASWQFADAVFGYGGSPPDTVVSTVKARRFGFARVRRYRGDVRAAADRAAGRADTAAMSRPVLVGDIGGTHARLALADAALAFVRRSRSIRAPSSTSGAQLVERYRRDVGIGDAGGCCVAIAGPVIDGRGKLTNGRIVCDAREIAAASAVATARS